MGFSQDHFKILFYLFGVIAIYILPTLVAMVAGNSKKGKVILVNLLLGWTVIGWVVSLIMALKKDIPSSANDND